MYKICRTDIGKSQELHGRIREFSRRLKRELHAEAVYLFGSFARNDVHEGSDIDLMIIAETDLPFCERIGKVLEMTRLPVEPIVYTSQEFLEMQRSGSQFIHEILKTAIRLV